MSTDTSNIELGQIVNLVSHGTPRGASNPGAPAFVIAKAPGGTRFNAFAVESGNSVAPETAVLEITVPATDTALWSVLATECVGDAPHLYHPAYVMALVSSEDFFNANSSVQENLNAARIPAIGFTTDEWTRRSMTLNGMRMSTEFFGTGSLRIMELVRQRLAAGQRDVIHDVLVYLMRQILQERTLANAERALRADSLAAYLGVNPQRVLQLLRNAEIEEEEEGQQVTSALTDGFAGPIRRRIDIAQLVANQLQLLRSEMRIFSLREQNVLNLIDPIAALLYADGTNHVG